MNQKQLTRWFPLFLNSADRSSGSIADCVVQTGSLSKNDVNESYTMLLKEFRTTMDVPNINTYSSVIDTSDGALTIPIGQYNAQQLTSVVSGLGVSISYTPLTNKYQFLGVSHSYGTTGLSQ